MAAAAALRERYVQKGQGHVFKFFDSLPVERQEAFLHQLGKIDLDEILHVHNGFRTSTPSHDSTASMDAEISPLRDVVRPKESERDHYRRIGYLCIADGRVCAVLMAGGQGTRLGSELPKGQYDVGLPSHRSLFEIQALRLIRLQDLARAENPDGRQPIIPWYIMTSPLTEAKTKAYFQERSYFGLDRANVIFFNQEDMPAVTPDGKLILEEIDRLSTAPNGNGAIFSAMKKTGCLADMDRRGVQHAFVYGVDNILVRIADPVMVGLAHEKQIDCTTKVVPKAFPEEPVGVVCLKGGKASVVEYSELPSSLATKRDSEGQLVFNSASIAMHLFSVKFLHDVVDKHLQQAHLSYHLAKKKIPTVNELGEKYTPKEPNGWKFELFVFDVFPFASHLTALEVTRDEEFSPLKNAEGAKSDSPNTCRTDINNLHRKFVTLAGGQINGDGLVEVSPALSYGGEGLEKLVKGKSFTAPVEIK